MIVHGGRHVVPCNAIESLSALVFDICSNHSALDYHRYDMEGRELTSIGKLMISFILCWRLLTVGVDLYAFSGSNMVKCVFASNACLSWLDMVEVVPTIVSWEGLGGCEIRSSIITNDRHEIGLIVLLRLKANFGMFMTLRIERGIYTWSTNTIILPKRTSSRVLIEQNACYGL